MRYCPIQQINAIHSKGATTLTPEEYDQKLKEMQDQLARDKQAIIAEYEQSKTNKEGLKESANEVLVNHSADAAQVIVDIARGTIFSDGKTPSFNTRLKAAMFVYEYGVMRNVEREQDEMEVLLDKLRNDPDSVAEATSEANKIEHFTDDADAK